MKLISSAKTDSNTAVLEISVDGQALRAATDKIFHKKVKTISVPGFRKGKAPRSIIEKMYGESVFLEEAVNELFPAAYEDAVDESGIRPVDKADVEVTSLDKNEGFTFKATVTVHPDVKLGKYKNLPAEKPVYDVTDKMIDERLVSLQAQNARIVTVTDRPAILGDAVTIDFVGFIDDKSFAGGKGDGYQLELGSGQFIAGFEEQIVGHNTSENFDVNVTFPADYQAAEFADKPAIFKVKLSEIKTRELPLLDDEFAKDVSEVDTLKDLRESIRAEEAHKLHHRSEDALETVLIDKVLENLTADIPNCMFEKKIDDLAADFQSRLRSQGLDLKAYLQYTGSDEANFRESFRASAERSVRFRLALEKISETEKIEISDAETESELLSLSKSYKMELEQLRRVIPMDDFILDIKCRKAFDIIHDTAKITEKNVADDSDEGVEVSEKQPEEKPKAKKAPAKKKAE